MLVRGSRSLAAGMRTLSVLPARLLERVPETTAGVRLIAVYAFILIRGVSIVQLGLALSAGALARAKDPTISLLSAAFFVAESIVVSWLFWRRRAPGPLVAALADAGTFTLLNLLQLVFSEPATRLDTWEAWVYGVSTSSVIAVACMPRWKWTIIGMCAMFAAYLIAMLPAAITLGRAETAISNSLGYLINPAVARLGWLYLLRLAAKADQAAQEAQRRREVLEQRSAEVAHGLHESVSKVATYLSQLGDRQTSPRAPIEDLESAIAHGRRILNGAKSHSDDDTLGGLMRRAAAWNSLVQVTCVTYQVEDLKMSPRVLLALGRALETLITNVQRHANVRKAVLHGSQEDGSFALCLTDEGDGFDIGNVAYGFGLRHVAGDELTRLGLSVSVQSGPGRGTQITISGPIEGG